MHAHLLDNDRAIVPVRKRRQDQEGIKNESLESRDQKANTEACSEDRRHPMECFTCAAAHLRDDKAAANVAEDRAGQQINSSRVSLDNFVRWIVRP